MSNNMMRLIRYVLFVACGAFFIVFSIAYTANAAPVQTTYSEHDDMIESAPSLVNAACASKDSILAESPKALINSNWSDLQRSLGDISGNYNLTATAGRFTQPNLLESRIYNAIVNLPDDSNLAIRRIDKSNNPNIALFDTSTLTNSLYFPIIFASNCLPLYFDDFSNPSSGWPVLADAYAQWGYLGGEYHIVVSNTDWVAARAPAKFSNYAISVDAHSPSIGNGSYGLLVGIADDWSEAYSFQIVANQQYGLAYLQNGVWEWRAFGSSGAINPIPGTNHLKLVFEGSSISMYVNGEFMETYSGGPSFGPRYVGLIAWPFGTPNFDARYDNFTVSALPCPD